MAKNDDVDLDELMKREREKYTARRGELQTEMDELDTKIARIDAYLGATAKPKQQRQGRAARGTTLTSVLEVVEKAGATGIAQKDIISQLSFPGQSVANALQGLKKDGKVKQPGGRATNYFPA